PVYWTVLLCNVFLPQMLWSRRFRRSALALFLISLVINTGMWLERYLIVVVSLHRDFMPSAWGMYRATIVDYAVFIGTLGFFVFMMLLFIRFLPAISIFEMRTLLPEAEVKEEAKGSAEWKESRPSTV
ncbi:MAG: hydrogenase, partial [Blastocatellia bacterium]|nr:hydrogenase [Blastocatellia bacterium]